ncbi:pirin family protein [Hyphobacterium marinum]|uniref:Pirin family protein n=1 Tax=Hyphobacterium marinum TaxID=3116574 RepID=A0ABU7LX29_9PROT|nr:pirin family protein [Hyphobacterium sp. Y6023]MEE2566075.1 pirin family protein [Hyphobacterium sp. Y6023]
MPKIRPLVHTTTGTAATDGAGVRMRRMIGTHQLPMIDPFLMLDHFHSDNPGDYIAGFPAHPHRGFETVTYMVAGRMRHKDNKGHEGVIEPGGVQWMTAAGGIIHSEMPEQEEGLMSGFQLWINLPRAEKMKPAGYQEFDPDEIPVDDRPDSGAKARIVAGKTSRGVEGPVRRITVQPFFAEVALEPGGVFEEALPAGHSAILAVFAGSVILPRTGSEEPGTVSKGMLGILGEGETTRIEAGPDGASLLLIAGKQLREPVAKGGPFVMNTEGEVRQAMMDYQSGRF